MDVVRMEAVVNEDGSYTIGNETYVSKTEVYGNYKYVCALILFILRVAVSLLVFCTVLFIHLAFISHYIKE